MSKRLNIEQVRELVWYLTDKMSDMSKPYSEVSIYFPEWLTWIHVWKEFDKTGRIVYN